MSLGPGQAGLVVVRQHDSQVVDVHLAVQVGDPPGNGQRHAEPEIGFYGRRRLFGRQSSTVASAGAMSWAVRVLTSIKHNMGPCQAIRSRSPRWWFDVQRRATTM